MRSWLSVYNSRACSAGAISPVSQTWLGVPVGCILGPMAKTTRVVLTCDLHGDDTDAVTTITVADGKLGTSSMYANSTLMS